MQQETNPNSTRAQFTQWPTSNDTVNAVNNYLPSPTTALEFEAPRTVEVVTSDGIPTGAWATGLFNCFDNIMPNCFMVTLCPCVALAQLSTRIGVASYRIVLSLLVFVMAVEFTMFVLIWTTGKTDQGDTIGSHDHDDDDKVANGTFAIITLIIQMMLFIYVWQLRAKTRALFQLPGNAVTDCMSSWFCSCCTVAQLRTHVRGYQPGNCTFRAPDVLQAYSGKSYAV